MLFKGESPTVDSVKVLNRTATDFGKVPAQIFHGDKSTRATVRAEIDADNALPIGSIYLSSVTGATTATKIYIKRAANKADADWERIVTAAAD